MSNCQNWVGVAEQRWGKGKVGRRTMNKEMSRKRRRKRRKKKRKRRRKRWKKIRTRRKRHRKCKICSLETNILLPGIYFFIEFLLELNQWYACLSMISVCLNDMLKSSLKNNYPTKVRNYTWSFIWREPYLFDLHNICFKVWNVVDKSSQITSDTYDYYNRTNYSLSIFFQILVKIYILIKFL